MLRISKILTLLTLMLFFFSCNAYASESVGYDFIKSGMEVTENFTLTLYRSLVASFEALFVTIAMITLVIHGLRWMLGKPDIVNLLKFFFTLVAVKTIAFNPGVFEEWFYRPVMSTTYSLPAYVLAITEGRSAFNSADSLYSMFSTIDSAINSIGQASDIIVEAKGGVLSISGLRYLITGLGIKGMYYALYIIFMVMFCVGIIAAHFLLAAAPFAVSLIAFEGLRGLSYNTLRNFFSYCLMPFFASVAMGITLFVIRGIVDEAQAIVDSGNISQISPTFFVEASIAGAFSIYFHIKAGQFASQVVGGQISDFGAGLASMMGLGGAIAKGGISLVGKMGGKLAGKLGSGAK